MGAFHLFLSCTNGTKSHNAPHVQSSRGSKNYKQIPIGESLFQQTGAPKYKVISG